MYYLVLSRHSVNININKKAKIFVQPLGQKKKCLEMISWHSTDDPVDDIFEFTVTRALR